MLKLIILLLVGSSWELIKGDDEEIDSDSNEYDIWWSTGNLEQRWRAKTTGKPPSPSSVPLIGDDFRPRKQELNGYNPWAYYWTTTVQPWWLVTPPSTASPPKQRDCPKCKVCQNFDPKLQAMNLEEAIMNFPDLTLNEILNTPPEQTTSGSTMSNRVTIQGAATGNSVGNSLPQDDWWGCPPNDKQCLQCAAAMIKRLEAVHMMDLTEAEYMRRSIGITNNTDTHCPKYRFSKPVPFWQYFFPTRPVSNEFTDLYEKCHLETAASTEWERIMNGRVPQRRKRSVPEDGIGERYEISCVGRGESEAETGEESSWVVQCDMCWMWRRLPNNYRPQFLNELVCNPSKDYKCLGGYGKCHQRSLQVDVEQNIGTDSNPSWVKKSISSGSCCECKVRTGSPLHAFISR